MPVQMQTDFDASVDVGPDGELTVRGSVRAASVDTREPKRDEHLRSAEFFDAGAHPEFTFVSTSVEPVGESAFRIVGDLTIRDVTRPVVLAAVRTIAGPRGGERLGIEARGRIDRTDFGLTWNAARETGGALVGNDVEIVVDVSAVRRPGPFGAEPAHG